MAEPIYLPLRCHRAVGFLKRIQRVGEDWTGSTFRMQVRRVPDAVSTAYWTLTNGAGLFLEYAGSATVSAHVAAGRLPPVIYDQINSNTGVNYVGTDVVALSILAIANDAAGTDVFPYEANHEKPVDYFYDLTRDPDGGGAMSPIKEFYGPFTVIPTATRP